MEKRRGRAAARAVMTSFLLFSAVVGYAEASIGERDSEIRGLGPRPEASSGEGVAFRYIAAALRKSGLQPSLSDFSDSAGNYSRSLIVEALVRGNSQDELDVVLPVGSWTDSPDPAEGSYGIALALDEASRLSALASAGMACPISVRFVFLGAEKRGSYAAAKVAALGSRTWISRQEGRSRLAVLYLNLSSEPARVALRSAGRGVLAPLWYYDGARIALESSGIPYNLEANRQQAYRLGLAADYGPAAPYLEAGIPSVELGIDAPVEFGIKAGAGQVGEAHPDWFSKFIDAFAAKESGGFSDAWDRHYFIIQVGRLVAALRERTYVAILVGLVALALSSLLAATVARRSAAVQLLKRAPAVGAEVLALFAVLVLVFLAGKGLARAEAAILGSADAWRLAPRLFASARLLCSFLLFLSILSYLVEKRVLSPNPYFYEFSGLVCLAIDVLVFSAVDLSASFYFIWALVLVEASLALRRRWATLAAYALMYMPLLVVAGELAIRPDPGAYARLVAPSLSDVPALSALSLPFFVVSASLLLFFARRGAAARKKAVAFLAAAALLAEASAVAAYLVAVPRDGAGRRDLSISEAIDQDKGSFDIILAGKRRLGAGSLIRGGARLDYRSGGDRVSLSGADGERRIRIGEAAAPFLDRIDESISVDFSAPPYELEIGLESDREIFIYDSSLPYKVAVDGKSAVLYAGVNPGPRLDFSITVPSAFAARLIVRARYLGPLEPCSQSSGSPLAYSGLTLKASRAIGGGGG